MQNRLNVFVSGANGRMGKQIIRMVVEDAELYLAGASEHPDSPVLGADAGLNAVTTQTSVSIMGDMRRYLEKSKGVMIDFSSIENTLENVGRAVEFLTPMVIGTTGFDAKQRELIQSASQKIPIMLAPNMSVGMNMMFKLVAEAARILKNDFDMEVFEMHHKKKVDSPSGTAMKLARILCEQTERKYPEAVNFNRYGMQGPRTSEEIGMQVLRGGDIVGEHTVYYCGNGERLEIKHVATSRSTFAAGSVRAAKWIQNQPPGLYDMEDVLGIA